MASVVVQISDTHLVAGTADRDRDEFVTRTLDAVMASGDEPALVMLTGDLADDGSRPACARLRDLVSALGVPMIAVAGNHDEPQHVSSVFGDAPAVVGPWSVVGIDTHWPGHDAGSVDCDEAARRLDEMADHHVLVAMHHPPISPSTNKMFDLEHRDRFLQLVAERPWVKAIASGHLHEPFTRSSGNVPIVGAPSTFYAIRHSGPTYEIDPGGVVGARVWRLADDGSFTHELIARQIDSVDARARPTS